MTLCIEKRGEIVNQSYLTADRVETNFQYAFGRSCF